MSDQKPAAESADAQPKKKSPIKMIAIVAVLMILEAVAVFVVVGMSAKKPAQAEAKTLHEGEGEHASVEIPLLDEKFQNMESGRVWVWDVAMVVRVAKKDEQAVTKKLQERSAEVLEGISKIFRSATHTQLREAELKTINIRVHAFLDNVVGKIDGKSLIERLLIPRCRGFEAG